MAQDEFTYEKEGPEPILRAFLSVLRGILEKKGFQEAFEHIDPENPDTYLYEKGDQKVSLTLAHSAPGTLTITATSGLPMRETLNEAVEAFIEGIRILLRP
ncbi:MAG: hypothetical protein ABIM88_06985 [candidate division WOR-3 bacterium]